MTGPGRSTQLHITTTPTYPGLRDSATESGQHEGEVMRIAHMPRAVILCLCLMVPVMFFLVACSCGGDTSTTSTTLSDDTTTTEVTPDSDDTATTEAEASTPSGGGSATTEAASPTPSGGGSENVAVPRVGFVTEAEGTGIIEGAGLEPAVTRVSASPAEHGMVIGQNPTAGTVVPLGSPVVLMVGVDEDLALLPDVVGMDLATATATLEAHGFPPPAVVYEESLDSSIYGDVIAQNPTGDVERSMYTIVILTVGSPIVIGP